MRLTVQLKLKPTVSQATSLRASLKTANAAADYISKEAWKAGEFRRFPLHNLVYRFVRDAFPLSAQIVCLLLGKVADAYKLDKKVCRQFRPLGSIAYDCRVLNINMATSSVSIWSVDGRLKMPFVCGERARALLAHPHGEADLIHRAGEFYLNVTVEIPEDKEIEATDVLGVDMGIVEIAFDSDGQGYSGSQLNRVRHRNRSLRKKLQRIGTKSAKRLLKKRSRRESNFARNTNHIVSKSIVDTAKRTNRAIAIEDLKGIRVRARARKRQRTKLHSWSFAQLGSFLEYKAALAGVPLVKIDPRYTSQRCGKCGHTEKANRKSQSVFSCKSCGHTANADHNGAGNIRLKGLALLGAGASTTQTRKAPAGRRPNQLVCNPVALAKGS